MPAHSTHAALVGRVSPLKDTSCGVSGLPSIEVDTPPRLANSGICFRFDSSQRSTAVAPTSLVPRSQRAPRTASGNNHLADTLGRPYTADVLSSAAEIHQLEDSVHRLMPVRDITVEPRFFLASLSSDWTPRVVVVRRGEAIVGVVYGKERRIGGFSTGIVYGDGRLGNLVVAADADREDVVIVAITSLFALPHVRAVRLAIPPADVEARAVARAQPLVPFDLGYSVASPFDTHARLPLPADYQEFLGFLGSKTRRNFRYYRRRFEAAGHTYDHDVSQHDLQRATADLNAKCRIRSRRGEIARAMNVLMAADRPWSVGLKHRDGSWLSVAAGWFSSGRAVMFLQLNDDRDHDDASLSVVLRAHLIETLIRSGTPELVFWSGSAPPLSRYAPPIPAMTVYLDTPALGWRLVRSMIGKTQPWMPRWIAADVLWMTGPKLSSEPPETLLPGRDDRPD
jgi:hypothetical protein